MALNPETLLQSQVQIASALLHEAHRIVVLTGAGYSTASGIPDFRSPNSGIWETYNPHEIASLLTFRHHPERFFNWFQPLARKIVNAQPNPAHIALAQLEHFGKIKAIITQNIDNLHQKAGSTIVYEVHGTIRTMTCLECYLKIESVTFLEQYLLDGKIPQCPRCSAVLKPDVILFEEQLPIQTWLAAEEACKKSDLILVAGSSLVVMPVAGLPMRALENGAKLIIVNHAPTYLDPRADIVIHADLVEAIPKIVQELIGA